MRQVGQLSREAALLDPAKVCGSTQMTIMNSYSLISTWWGSSELQSAILS